jgi:ABC-type branched-subunit amino acid transport system substrate-binding protein
MNNIPNKLEDTGFMLRLFRLFSSPISPAYVQYTGSIVELTNQKILCLKSSLFKSVGYILSLPSVIYLLVFSILLFLTSCSQVTVKRQGNYYENILTGEKVEVVEEQADYSKLPESLHVAMLLPLEGKNMELGQYLLDAAQLAIHDLDSKHIRLIPISTGVDNVSLQKAVDKIVDEKIDIILGPVFAHEAAYIHKKLQVLNKQMPILTLSNDISLLNKKGLYLFGIMPDQQVRRIMQFAKKQGYNNIAAIVPRNHYGEIVKAVVNHPQEEVIASIIESYDPSQSLANSQEFNESILRLHKRNPDALLIADGGIAARNIIQQIHLLQQEHKPIQILAISNWDDVKLHKLPAAFGTWYANLPSKGIKSFENRFNENFGYKPARISVLAYEALIFIASLKKAHGSIRSSDFLNDVGFKGVTGVFRLNEDGYVDRGLVINEITSNGIREIESAPSSLD